ncbi:hypothetical protein J7I98_30320 [Streptomyces sp. ISL-98]|uniref:phenylalanine--tRNA ligase beta subunit-related protein n=1 Tax=Streptomyces sp. ISL-98 TaxID=2819192 RepID=UPI001BEC15D3|nr:phenylalanine--tRNA ligase beta subunit-related protein [Streptomyces sp. ISL-98]MBT2510077.1 hypothetical protein [Streptomyces sp. ISL-98]
MTTTPLGTTFRRITVSPAARDLMPGVEVLTLAADITADTASLAVSTERLWSEAHAVWHRASRSEVRNAPHTAAYRDLSRMLGAHPDKQPPSVQALVDRGLRGKPLGAWPRINPAVDAVNAVAVSSLVALGVFDRDKLEGDVRLELAAGEEEFTALGADGPVALEAGRPVLADDRRVLSLFAHRDGVHQAVTAETRRVLLLACSVPGVDADTCRDALVAAHRLLTGQE